MYFVNNSVENKILVSGTINLMFALSKKNKSGRWVLALIVALAVIVRIYNLDLGPELPPEYRASVVFSILAGIASVAGFYFLVKELFDEKLALIASFLLAVSSWHVFISKLDTKDILTSFTLTFAFYFIWRGLKSGRIFDFFLAGLAGGAGFYAGRSYFPAFLVVLLLFWNYWDYIKKDFPFSKYEEVKANILSGFALLVLITVATILPVGFYVWQNPELILSTDNSIFANTEPIIQIFKNISWAVDKLLLIKFDGTNFISWPLSIFFAIGFIKELVHWLKRKHGHFSVAHTLIFGWLFIMTVPTLLSADRPSILGLGIILPPIMILAAKGLWWTIEKLNVWNHLVYPRQHRHWAGLDVAPFLALLALLVSIAILEISKTI